MKPAQLLIILGLAFAGAVQAQPASVPAKAGASASKAAVRQRTMANGEVLEIDNKDKRVLVKHGPIRNLGMDAMTMEFNVPDDKLLASLRPGDKIRFSAVWKDGEYAITGIQVMKRKESLAR